MNCFSSLNCLTLLVGAAMWCGVLSEHQKGVKCSSRRIFPGKDSEEPLGAALIQPLNAPSPAGTGELQPSWKRSPCLLQAGVSL